MQRNNQAVFNTMGRAGFTLIELSIVLVIIGLIIGGVVTGRDLIRTAENRAFISQLEKYNGAVNAFRTKYNCLPGDCNNATAYGFTGNGDGNGAISALWINSACDNSADTTTGVGGGAPLLVYDNSLCGYNESKYLWKHLESAGLLSNVAVFNSPDGLYVQTLPAAKNDGRGIIVVSWNGKPYFRGGLTGFNDDFGGPSSVIQANFELNYSPADAAYIYAKMGGERIAPGNAIDYWVPDGIVSHDRIIPIGYDTLFPRFFSHPPSAGAGGAASNVCVDTSVTPNVFNAKNPAKICGLMIRADF